MSAQARLVCLTLVMLATSACSILQPESREEYEGADKVADVLPERIMGLWTTRPLNPLPRQREQRGDTRVEYRADRTVVSEVPAPPGDDFGGAMFRLSGTWQVQNGFVIHDAVTVSTTSQHANAIGLRDLLNQSPATGRTIVDVFELEESRMVLVGRDGVAVAYTREEGSLD